MYIDAHGNKNDLESKQLPIVGHFLSYMHIRIIYFKCVCISGIAKILMQMPKLKHIIVSNCSNTCLIHPIALDYKQTKEEKRDGVFRHFEKFLQKKKQEPIEKLLTDPEKLENVLYQVIVLCFY